MQDKEYQIESGLGALEEFKKSRTWKDIQGILNDGLEMYQEEMESRAEITMNDVYEIRGRISQVKLHLTLADALIDLKKQQLEDFDREKKNG